MLFYSAGQEYVFLLMAATGLVMGLWSDFCLSLECLIGSSRFARIFTDLTCTLGITILLFFAMLFSTRLDFRLYSVGAAGLGAAIYRIAVHPVLKSVFNFIRKKLKCLCNSYNLKKIFQFLCK
ncbi:MAG: spore cortex biosynthesis protein YabQ [Clostridia bacterium]|nr:spore cortex biosynthesis protein YabQ [Clostridia bacterium]MBQ2434175.1 spore cortex biosynthesis protein YabQ [Clostridia bacterium]MBQ5771084.1 spore cortex biosynthesis protein YabQ [Clostridia bacterium]